ncbi:polysaccharide biosynthesis protein [Bacillaceae bacterium IKA-2]|nr:polysaccharide biosynthesis protein [Bacillaceae bacterium IKA-2]
MVRKLENPRRLWQGAVYLSLAAIVIKILSAIYRIPYQNIAGDVGFYVYQQIYPIYGIAIMLSTFGFPVIISKLIGERENEENQIIKSAYISLFLISFFVFIIFYVNAPLLARMMGDENLLIPLKTVSFIFFVIPFLSVLRGFFQGNGEMLPTAVSQVTEQVTRVIVILLLTYFLISNGYGPYAAGTGAAIGSVIGGLVGFITLFIFYKKQGRTVQQRRSRFSLRLVKIIVIQGMMICFSSLLLIIFQFVDAVTVLRILLENGVHIEIAKVSKGVFDRGQPLIQMGTVITTSFSLIVVPLIAKVSLEGRQDLIQKYTSLALRISFLMGAAASVGLAIIIEPTNIMLFKNETDSVVLAILGMAILFTAIFLTSSAVLHGLNKVYVTVNHVIVGLIVKIILNVLLIPIFGTMGAAVATVFACAICAVLNIITLRKIKALPRFSAIAASKALLSLMAMAIATFIWKQGSIIIYSDLLQSRLGNMFIALSSVVVGAVIFIVCLIIGRVFTNEELDHIPKLKKFAVLMQSEKSG